MKINRSVLLSACLLLSVWNMFGHEVNVHRLITLNAEQEARLVSPGYSNFLFIINPSGSHTYVLKLANRTAATPLRWMLNGNQWEDNVDVPGDVGKSRPYNHFYDPVHHSGLTDVTHVFDSTAVGLDSFSWASISNVTGIDSELVYDLVTVHENRGASNIWTWQNARGYQMLGLTNAALADRSASLANLFRSLGQVLHLLQDQTSPQHTRNEQHLEYVAAWRSIIEKYGQRNCNKFRYPQSMLDWNAAGFTKAKSFWDTGAYGGSHTDMDNTNALNDDAAAVIALGLAEFTSGNFIGQRSVYRELAQKNYIHTFPFPSLFTSTDYKPTVIALLRNADASVFRDLSSGLTLYIHKIADGISILHHSKISFLGAFNWTVFSRVSLDDENVLSELHGKLLPKAVQYSAGLLDYYFRGTLDTILTGSTNGTLTFSILNTSSQDLRNGQFHLYWDDTNSVRTELTGTNFTTSYTNALASGDLISATFTSPTNATNFVLVYQGTVGSVSNVALDPVDAGIAVATKSFNLSGLNFNNLVWDAPILLPGGDGGTASGTSTGNHASGSTAYGDPSMCPSNSQVIFHSTLNYTGPTTSCSMNIAAVSNFNGLYDYDIIVSQDGIQILDNTLINFNGSSSFTVLAGSASVIDVYIMQLSEGCMQPVADTLDATYTLTPAY